MPETCNPKDCPVSARVEALKEEFNTYRANSSNTHRQMFERIGALEQNRAALNEKLDSMRKQKESLLEEYGKENKIVGQLIDLALLANGLLKGEALNNFVKRSVELIK